MSCGFVGVSSPGKISFSGKRGGWAWQGSLARCRLASRRVGAWGRHSSAWKRRAGGVPQACRVHGGGGLCGVQAYSKCYPGTTRPPLSFDPNPILSTATTLFTRARAAKSAHFLVDREEKRLNIMYNGWTPSPSPTHTNKWEAAWLESGAFCNTSTSCLTLRCRLPKQIEHIQGDFPSPRCVLGGNIALVLTFLTRRPPSGMGGEGVGIDISKPPISIRLMARSDPANAPRARALTPVPVPMMLHNTQHTTHPRDAAQPTVYGRTMVGWGWEIPASLKTHDSYLLNHTHAHTHANRCPISRSCN